MANNWKLGLTYTAHGVVAPFPAQQGGFRPPLQQAIGTPISSRNAMNSMNIDFSNSQDELQYRLGYIPEAVETHQAQAPLSHHQAQPTPDPDTTLVATLYFPRPMTVLNSPCTPRPQAQSVPYWQRHDFIPPPAFQRLHPELYRSEIDASTSWDDNFTEKIGYSQHQPDAEPSSTNMFHRRPQHHPIPMSQTNENYGQARVAMDCPIAPTEPRPGQDQESEADTHDPVPQPPSRLRHRHDTYHTPEGNDPYRLAHPNGSMNERPSGYAQHVSHYQQPQESFAAPAANSSILNIQADPAQYPELYPEHFEVETPPFNMTRFLNEDSPVLRSDGVVE